MMHDGPAAHACAAISDAWPAYRGRASRFALLVVLCVLAAFPAACAAVPGGAGAAPAPLGAANEERVVLTEFDVITGVAASRRTVFVAGRSGIAALDRDFGRWLPPVALEPDFGSFQSAVMAADPVEDGVWLASGGMLLYYRASTRELVRGSVPGVVYDIYFDQGDPGAGAYLRTSAGWAVATRTGLLSPVSASRVPSTATRGSSPSLRDVYAAYPSLQGAAPLLTRDADLRSWSVLSAAVSPDREEVWLGTAGGGVFRVDPLFMKSEQLPFGPLQTAISALAHDSSGVWMTGADAGAGVARAGLAYTSSDLQSWRWLGSPAISRALSGARPLAMSARGGRIWVGTDRGVVALDEADPGSALRWSATNGLPGDRVYSVAASTDGRGAWIAGERGIAFITREGTERAPRASDVHAVAGAGVAAYALLLEGDTLWVGSASGLFLLRGASPDSVPRRVNVAEAPRLERPVYALAASDSLVAAATDRELVVIDVAAASLLPRYDAVNVASVAPVAAMAMDAGAIWLVGRGGVLVVSRASGASRLLASPGPIPAEPSDIVLDRDFAWIATANGVVRLRRAGDGGVR